jgi:hypothetical protein
MATRPDFGSTDIARQSASVLITVGVFLVRVLLGTALPCLVLAMAVSAHEHVALAPSLLVHHFGTATTGTSLPHLIATITVAFLGVSIEVLALSRVAFASAEPGAVTRFLATARRALFGARRTAVAAVTSPFPRRSVLAERDAEYGILRQLRRALSIAPLAPPRLLTLNSDPLGSLAKSGHRVEVGVAA